MGKIYVVGTCDTKDSELRFVKKLIEDSGLKTVLADVSTTNKHSKADVTPPQIASHHSKGASAVFLDDRGLAVEAMASAFQNYISSRDDVKGIIGLGGSGGTALITPAMRFLPVGTPKVMVSTMASGNTAPYVGPSDICMMYSVTDVAGLNRISRQVLGNAANAIVGMAVRQVPLSSNEKPAIGLTMFGVTTPCVTYITERLAETYDCLVFHATGTGGQSMEKLVDSKLIGGVIDVTTTEVCDLLLDGVMSAGEDRLGSIIRTGVPYVGSCGALDMVNFGARATVPDKYQNRNLYMHNPHVTLMRTTPDENRLIGEWIGHKLNECSGPVSFYLPEKGVSLMDVHGKAFHDPYADAALFEALEKTVNQNSNRQITRLPHNINDPEFAQALLSGFIELNQSSKLKT